MRNGQKAGAQHAGSIVAGLWSGHAQNRTDGSLFAEICSGMHRTTFPLNCLDHTLL